MIEIWASGKGGYIVNIWTGREGEDGEMIMVGKGIDRLKIGARGKIERYEIGADLERFD